ncbi:hypothetical protein CHS0354_041312 [Potamilus streckersoni]|uniref:Uncharacterized protein n=1 Tax=Potamilus streckersoni TaxID=2493646 RepID=A0AAE0SE30_9BIVA|nr:hypothetical protein CHS0354_041312 [Potamilus streckersoni]
MTHTDQRKESKCRLLTLLLILLVSVVGANKINSTGSYRPIFNLMNWSSLFNQTSLPDKTKEGGVPTKISKVMLQNKESNNFVRIFKKGRKGVDAFGTYYWNNTTSNKPEHNPFAILIFTPNENSQYPYFTIQGGANAYYLCFKKNGALVVKVKGHSSRCEFKEVYSKVDPNYKEIISKMFPNFKLGFNKKGKPLNGIAHSKTKKQGRFMFHIKRLTNDPASCKREHGPVFNVCYPTFLDKLVDSHNIRHNTKKGGHRNNGKRKR